MFANIQFHLEYLKKLPISKRITGEWTRDTAGGCANYRETTNKNPIHLIQVDRPTEFIVELRAPKEYSGNFQIRSDESDSLTQFQNNFENKCKSQFM